MAEVRELPEFEWDEANSVHVARHDISTEEVEQVLRNQPVVGDVQVRKGEVRIMCFGRTDRERLLTVIYAVRHGRIRAVTAHPMNRRQRRVYETSSAEVRGPEET